MCVCSVGFNLRFFRFRGLPPGPIPSYLLIPTYGPLNKESEVTSFFKQSQVISSTAPQSSPYIYQNQHFRVTPDGTPKILY